VEDLEQRFARRSAWQRWRSRPWQAEVLQCCRRLVAETQGPLLATLGDGYQLICGRLQRMLAEQRIERLACAGQSVDPAQMRVIELVGEKPSDVGAGRERWKHYVSDGVQPSKMG